MAQSLGLLLTEIAAIAGEHRAGGLTPARSVEITKMQLARLEEKAAMLSAMADSLRAKIAWVEKDQKGPEPEFGRLRGCG
ncbi:MAG TPA: hypothetical protein VMA37_18665 [Acetobacteraceae bacterium]|nr:hypothetical protein [Acetobacteraceae bacterium]